MFFLIDFRILNSIPVVVEVYVDVSKVALRVEWPSWKTSGEWYDPGTFITKKQKYSYMATISMKSISKNVY